jgi:hypothetical protein
MNFYRTLLAVGAGYALNVVANYVLVHTGFVPGPVPHDNIRIMSVVAAVNLLTAVAAGWLCAQIAGRRSVFVATIGLMAAYFIGGVYTGRQMVAAGQLPFSLAVITLLCVGIAPIGAIVYVIVHDRR